MEEQIKFINVPANLDRLLNAMNGAPSDKAALILAFNTIIHFRDELGKTETMGCCKMASQEVLDQRAKQIAAHKAIRSREPKVGDSNASEGHN